MSKGKKSKKRKRGSVATDADLKIIQNRESSENGKERPKATPLSAPPPIFKHLLLGFNNVTRHLEELSTLSAPQSGATTSISPDVTRRQHIAAVFLFHPLDDLIYSHLPTLCHTASLAHTGCPPTRLVLLDPAIEKRVAGAAGLPRLSVLGVMDTQDDGLAEVDSLVQYVRQHVKSVEVPWLKEAIEGRWLGTKIDTH